MLNLNYQTGNVNFKVKPLTVFGSLLSNTLQKFELYLKVGTKIGTQSVHFRYKDHRDSLRLTKQKTLKTNCFKGFLVHPAGLEPATC